MQLFMLKGYGRMQMRHRMNTKRANAKGFTLIELMIVVAIVGILAAIAIPNFIKFQCRSKQTEAKTSLTALYVAEESYRAEFSKYVVGAEADMAVIGFAVKPGAKRRYSLSVVGTDTSYTAFANGLAGTDVDGDIWTIDHNKTVTWDTASTNCR